MKRPMTPSGYNTLRKDLIRLKAMRPELANEIERARELGDLKENADYDEAKRNSGMIEARIRDLEAKLAQAEIVTSAKLRNVSKVVFGISVRIEEVDSGEAKTISIVGADESDVDKGLISFESPLARGLIGKEVGDIARVAAPGGARDYEIMEIFLNEELLTETEAGVE
jgi:transcription elongation factor GreA